MNLVDMVQVTTQIIGTIIAIIMAYLAWKTYLKKPHQGPEPAHTEDTEAEVGPLRTMIVFDTTQQQTTLRATGQGIECHLEDKKQGQIQHQWTISKHQCREILKNKRYSVNPGYKANTGLFAIGQRTNWLYSKKLFPESYYLEDALRQILTTAIGE